MQRLVKYEIILLFYHFLTLYELQSRPTTMTSRYNVQAIYITIVIQLCYLCMVRGDSCASRQYLEIGHRETIRCLIEDGFTLIVWYNNPDYLQTDPVLELRGTIKSGSGWNSKEFDVHLNGSLIINEVALKHETTFTVRIYRGHEFPSTVQVDVQAKVTPPYLYPVIDNCDTPDEICLTRSNQDSKLVCGVYNSRPEISVTWISRTPEGDKNTTSSYNSSSDALVSNYSVSIMNPFVHSSFLALFVCQADDKLMMLKRNQSLILTENQEIDLSLYHHKRIVIERGKMLDVPCSNNSLALLLWRNTKSSNIILYGIYIKDTITKVFEEGFDVGSKGSMIISEVSVRDEGSYVCIYNDWKTEGLTISNISVLVYPDPTYLVVEGCNPDTYCTLQVNRMGSLRCEVKGIRPVVKLEWRVYQESSADLLLFTNQDNSITNNGDTSVVTLTTQFEAKEMAPERLTVECRATGEHANLFDLKISLDLLIAHSGNLTTKRPVAVDNGTSTFVVILLILLGTILLAATVIVVYIAYRQTTRPKKAHPNDEEKVPMINNNLSVSDKKKLLIAQLKGCYENLYNGIQPIPYMKDMYAVNSLFVEGGIECLVSDKAIKQEENWQSLDSYKCIKSDHRVRSTRRIIEAEPGYGKSTLTLQLAYEWCDDVQESILQNVEILILVKLRQLQNVSCIYEAIRRFLLPRDSRLVVDDIKTILGNVPPESVFIILDGFDEFPDSDNKSISDILDILRRRMFADFEVILTTRSSCLPNEYAPQTKRMRLTGFDKAAQEKYLLKAVTKDDEVATVRVKEALKDNPILVDLCQVPLLFVMFAHLSRKSDELRTCTSVTIFFRYMVSSLYNHFKRKMDDQNVEVVKVFENDHNALDKLAFQSIARSVSQDEWRKDKLRELLGSEFLDQFLSIGILREFEVTEIVDDPGTLESDHVQRIKKVKFYHKLFCEWYAAHYVADALAKHIANKVENTPTVLESLDPTKFQYVYRFACGINETAAKVIIPYLQDMKGRDKFAMLCILEQRGNVDDIIDNVKSLCAGEIQLGYQDTRLLQRSIVQLMEIASTRNIPITSLWLEDCVNKVDALNEEIVLKSTIRLPVIKSLKELCIDERGADKSNEETNNILEYATACCQLQTIKFSHCLLPHLIKKGHSFTRLIQRNVKVLWYPQMSWYQLDLNSGEWRYKDSKITLEHETYVKEAENLREMKLTLEHGKGNE